MRNINFCFYLLFISINTFAQTQWRKFTLTADSLEMKYEFDESLAWREKALKAAKNEPDSIQKKMLGLRLFTQSEYDFSQSKGANPEAYASMQKAIDILKKAKVDSRRMSISYRRLAENTYDYMYNLQDVEKHLEMAFAFFDKSTEKDSIYLLEMMQFSGFIKAISHKFDESIKTSEKGLELLERFQKNNYKDDDLKAKLYYNLSLVYGASFLNIPRKEHQYALESQKLLLSQSAPDIEGLVINYRRMALLERDYNNYPKAMGYMNMAMELYEKNRVELNNKIGFKVEMQLYRANILIAIGSGDDELMLKNLEKVECIVKNYKLDEVEKGNYKGILNDITRYYMGTTTINLDLAIIYNNKALALTLDSKNTPYSIETFNQTARLNEITIYFLKKEYQKALVLISELEKTKLKFTEKILFQLKAKCLLAIGNEESAINVINQLLLSISEENQCFQYPQSKVEDFHPGFIISDVKLLIDLAKSFHEFHGKYTLKEEKLYWMALSQMENNIGTEPLNNTLKSVFNEINSGLINAALERSFSCDKSNRLIAFIDVLSSQESVNNFLLKRELAGNTKLYKMVEEEQYIRSYITYLKKEYQKSKDGSIKQQLFKKELELDKINEEYTAQYRQSALFADPKIDLNSKRDKNIIKFKVAGNDLFKIRVYDGEFTYKKINDYPLLKQEIEEYLSLINNLEVPISCIKQSGARLFEKLFTDDFNTNTSTVIIPDDILHYVPFEILVKDNSYLMENHNISYASNIYFINAKSSVKNSSKSKKVVFFAPEYSGSVQESQLAFRGNSYSLKGASAEVQEISNFISGTVYSGESASKTNFKSLEGNLSILHLAMHSNLNYEDSELSNLLFSNVEKDYEMYISELYGMSFNADLVVLSACNTGIGGFKDGGNLVSMHQTFTIAGIPATIASLWNAPDQSTKDIMVAFYKDLQLGKDKATALRNAKLSYLKKTEDINLQHPFYWAGFVLSGDESPVKLVSNSFLSTIPFGLILLSGLIVLGMLVYFIKQKNWI